MGTDFSEIEGTGSLGVMLVGEASGEHEQRDQLPFRPYAPAGGVLERVLRRMGVDRQQLATTNCLRCRPRNNWLEGAPWEFSALTQCRPNLDAAISSRKPRAIVALGGIATRELTGQAGEARGVTHLAGYVLPLMGGLRKVRHPCTESNEADGTHHPHCLLCGGEGWWETEEPAAASNAVPIIPNFHPAFIRRGKASHIGVFSRILQRAINIAKGTDKNWIWNVDPEVHSAQLGYRTRPTRQDAEDYATRLAALPAEELSYDIETSESASLDEDAREGFTNTQLELVQFSAGPLGSIAIPWRDEFKPTIQRLLHSPNPKCGHNVWLFDNKVLRAAGVREALDLTPKGIIHDTLAMFHHWQPDLPAHLQFAASFVQFPFPWKHLAGTNLPFYGCADVDATLRLYAMLEATLKRDGIWQGYMSQVYEVRPVLAAMESRGMPIDDAARVALGREFEIAQAEIGRKIAAQVPPDCGLIDVFAGLNPELRKWFIDHGTQPKFWQKHPQDEVCEMMVTPRYDDEGKCYHYEYRKVKVAGVDAAGEPCEVEESRWCRVWDFNPNSRPQVIAYMNAKGHPVPKDRHREDDDGNNPETTAEKELRRLANKTGDTFYLDVIEYRGMTKLRGTYVDGFAPGPDGCVHTTFTFGSAIAQLTSRNPNTQNFPKLKPTVALATAMRRMVAAKPGKVITEWDYKSCHVQTLGFLAEDLNYMRMGRLDIHSFVAGHFLNLWDGRKIIHESDDELRARFKWLKSDPERKRVRDDQAKHAILGIGNGLKARGLFERYMESFPPRPCPACSGTGKVPGVRGLKHCPACKGLAFIPGQRIAEEVLEICELLFTKVFEFQRREVKVAHEQQYLKTDFGHLRRFYEVFRWDPRKGAMAPGDQHEEAIAYRLANIAHAHLREAMKELGRRGLDEKYGMYNQIHDALQFHFDERLLDEHVQEIREVLVAPSKVLRHPTICPDGLVIDVEAAYGRTWAMMEPLNVKQEAVA
jgi:uracil-DNA glycosylase family 4